mmetsp:Transcript_38987/g.123796  ORF Transcript_38987/g.123796 Transcript_38987/m.123796 type:complete len:371 (+) Transcript_38987:122-1234(+)
MALRFVTASLLALGASGAPSCASCSFELASLVAEELNLKEGATVKALCEEDAGVGLKLLQTGTGRTHAISATSGTAPAAAAATTKAAAPDGGLVLAHIPYNFGHTIEKVAAYGTGNQAMATYGPVQAILNSPTASTESRWAVVKKTTRSFNDSILWGHMNPDLFALSKVTGCPLYYTPGKYWPTEVAEAYFGNKTIFGMLRDPYERLVAMFRGNIANYGGSYPEFVATCDVNGAVRKMMTDYLAGHTTHSFGCTFVPQSEYFDAPFGIEIAVDNRLFPDSANKLFAERGANNLFINTEDILHVTGCENSWTGDLDCETKALVKQVYVRDFKLLCEKFGYCDQSENTCLKGVPQMCPPNLTAKELTATHCV